LIPTTPHPSASAEKCFAREGRQAEARAQYRECLQRSIDDGFAMRELLGQCATPAQRGEALSFIQTELIRQTTFGQGILEFAELALPFLSPEQLLSLLQQAQTERSDLWQAWSALINHMVAMKRTDEALAMARSATERFPLASRLWFDLACVHRARLEHSEQLAALEQARQISPTWSYVSRQLAEALQSCGRLQEAKIVVEQTVARSRQDAFNHGLLADLLWKSGEKEKALEELRESILLEPGYEWAWSQLEEWGQEMKQPHLRRNLAEELTRRRPGEARSWWLLANALNETDDLNRCLECLDKAIERNPQFVAAWRSRATALANAGRYDDALAACRPTSLDPVPPELLATAAVVHAKRQDLPAAIREMAGCARGSPQHSMGLARARLVALPASGVLARGPGGRDYQQAQSI
jgi:tetratricopeptide (TPR) repeat protein